MVGAGASGVRMTPVAKVAEIKTAEAATRLGVSESTVLRLIRDGLLPGARMIGRGQGKAWLIPARSVEKYARTGRAPAVA